MQTMYSFQLSCTLVCRGHNDELVSRQRDARKFITPWLTAKAAGREVGTADTLRWLREQDAGLLPDQQERALKRLLSRGWQVCFELSCAQGYLGGMAVGHVCHGESLHCKPHASRGYSMRALQVCHGAWHCTVGRETVLCRTAA